MQVDKLRIGKLKKVALRALWKREDKDFSQWLEGEISTLNEVLDLDITIEKREERVGPFRVDLYGEHNGSKVIIENQLEKTDHDHLGKLLTYLTNLEAKIAIWVSSEPVEEHVKVIEWLNEITPDDVFFYLVKLEAVQIEGHPVAAPLFTVVSGPSRTAKQIGAEKKEFAERHTIRLNYWEQFINEMNKLHPYCKNVSPSRDNWIPVSLGVSSVSINVVVTKKSARVELYINRGDKDVNESVFDQLFSQKEKIEADFGGALGWERKDDNVTCRIRYEKEGVNVADESDWPKMNEFLIDAVDRMYKAFKGPVNKLKL